MKANILGVLAVLGSFGLLANACTITTNDTDDDGDPERGGRGGSAGVGGSPANGGTSGLDGTAGETADAGMGGAASGGANGEGGAAGGAGDSGDAGMGGAAGAGAGLPHVESCDEADDNDTRAKALLLTSTATLCLAGEDTDFLELRTPNDGRAHVVSLELEQEVETRVQLAAFAAADNSELGTFSFAKGVTRAVYLTLGPGTKTYLQLSPYFGEGLVHVTASFAAEKDANEPNNERSMATELALGTDMDAQLLVPYTAADDQLPDDWYKVELPVGTATLNISNVPENLRFSVTVFNATGTQVSSATTANAGAALVNHTILAPTAGEYFIQIADYFSAELGPFITAAKPKHLTETYTLRVD